MYISNEKRKKIAESIMGIRNPDDLVYAITGFILQMWNEKPNDATIFVITKELTVDPKHSEFVSNLRSGLAHAFTVDEIYTACRLAYDEFYNRIVRLHHASQCRENGDIEGYVIALQPLLATLGTEIKKEKTEGLILPK